ncbi:hypothetical protein RI367_006758 [Sorochytrium milnesiophthora]
MLSNQRTYLMQLRRVRGNGAGDREGFLTRVDQHALELHNLLGMSTEQHAERVANDRAAASQLMTAQTAADDLGTGAAAAGEDDGAAAARPASMTSGPDAGVPTADVSHELAAGTSATWVTI